jgi:hypothetical protein
VLLNYPARAIGLSSSHYSALFFAILSFPHHIVLLSSLHWAFLFFSCCSTFFLTLFSFLSCCGSPFHAAICLFALKKIVLSCYSKC